MRRPKELLSTDGEGRAVSPVIGVILMVAITVILAAVIATFVIGLGDSTDDVSPNIAFETQNDITAAGSTNVTTLSIDTADSGVNADNIQVNVNGTTESFGENSVEISAGNELTIGSGQDVDVKLTGGEEITITFETDDSSDTLDTFTVPEP